MAFPGICLANSAIRCCFVETLAGPEFPGIFPSNGSVFRQSLGSDGSLGLVPRPHRYYELLRLPAIPPAALRCLRLARATPSGLRPRHASRTALIAARLVAVPSCARLFVSPPGVGTPPVDRGSLDCGFHDHFLSGLYHTACWLPVYASQSRSPFPTQHSVLGCWPALPDGIGYPLGTIARFRAGYVIRPPRPGLPGAREFKDPIPLRAVKRPVFYNLQPGASNSRSRFCKRLSRE